MRLWRLKFQHILHLSNPFDAHAIYDIETEVIITTTNQIDNIEEISHHISCGIQEGDDILAITSSLISDAKFSKMISSLKWSNVNI